MKGAVRSESRCCWLNSPCGVTRLLLATPFIHGAPAQKLQWTKDRYVDVQGKKLACSEYQKITVTRQHWCLVIVAAWREGFIRSYWWLCSCWWWWCCCWSWSWGLLCFRRLSLQAVAASCHTSFDTSHILEELRRIVTFDVPSDTR